MFEMKRSLFKKIKKDKYEKFRILFGRLRQEDHEFEANLGCMVRSYIKKKKKEIVPYVSVIFTVASFLMLVYGLQRVDENFSFAHPDNLSVE